MSRLLLKNIKKLYRSEAALTTSGIGSTRLIMESVVASSRHKIGGSYLDGEIFLSGLGMAVHETRIKRESYLIEGMSCAGCERTIEQTLKKIDGITSAKADLSSSTADIEYDPDKVNIEQIKTAVSSVGYRFAGERPAYGQREGSDEAIP